MQEALAPADNASYRLAMLERLCARAQRSVQPGGAHTTSTLPQSAMLLHRVDPLRPTLSSKRSHYLPSAHVSAILASTGNGTLNCKPSRNGSSMTSLTSWRARSACSSGPSNTSSS